MELTQNARPAIDVTAFTGLVDGSVRRMFKNFPAQEKEEAKAIGLLALCEAERAYDPARKRPFAAFAKVCVYRKLAAYLRSLLFQRGGVSISDNDMKVLARLQYHFGDEWPEYEEAVKVAGCSRFNPTLYQNLKDYNGQLGRPILSLVPEIEEQLVCNRRIRG